MELETEAYPAATLHARNIGGIVGTTVEFSPGVTLLVGRNATNRTSFLQAVIAALGSDNVAIKGDADEAEVELTLGDDTYSRQLHRRSGNLVTSGEPYLDDAELADLFAFLLESNEARRAVATNDDLRELIMRPLDVEEIQAEIDQLVQERDSLNQELEEIDDLKGELPELETQRARLRDQIEGKKAELEAKEEELEAADADIKETREEKSELDDKLEELREKRSDLDDVRYDIETERESLESLKQEQNELEVEYDELPETPSGEVESLEAEIRRLREQKQTLESEMSELQSIIGFNEEMLEDADSGTFTVMSGDDAENLTDQLLDEDEVTCWTCGSEVERDQIEATVSQLRELRKSKVGQVKDLDEEIGVLTDQKGEFEHAQKHRDRLERRLTNIEGDIEQSEERINLLQDEREELTDAIEDIEAEVDELEDEDYSAVLDLHKEANQLEYELGKLENDIERVESDISDIEARIAKEPEIDEQVAEVNAAIEGLRTRIERVEEEAIDQFNEHMDTVLEILDYENLDRIWLERVETEVREGRRKVTKNVFELHVVRTGASGAAYEDTADHLSESEREVTGLVFALAGYLAHEVYDVLPFMLLDSLEAIDSERIATLINYLDDFAGYLLVALLPEDAGELTDEYTRITEI